MTSTSRRNIQVPVRFVVSIAAIFLASHSFAKSSIQQCEDQFIATDVKVHKRISLRPNLIKGVSLENNGTYSQSLTEIAQAINIIRTSSNSPDAITETVLYPFSGYDLTAPLMLFPNAKTYILIDANSVIPEHLIAKIQRRTLNVVGQDRNKDWVHWRETHRDVFLNLLKSIFNTVPGSEITKADFIVGTDGNVSLELRFIDPGSGSEKTVHYWAAKVGAYPVNIRKDFGDPPVQAHWWESKLAELAPRTVLVKGSQSVLRLTANDDFHMRLIFISGVISRGGLVVEGASVSEAEDLPWTRIRNSGLKLDRTRWELSDGDPKLANPVRSIELGDVEFSYARKARVSLHAPQKKQYK